MADSATETIMMPAHQASADPSGVAPPSSSPRIVSVTGVAGWFSANPRSHQGRVRTGTNALLAYVKNIRNIMTELAASGARTSSPNAAASQDTAATKNSSTPSAAAK